MPEKKFADNMKHIPFGICLDLSGSMSKYEMPINVFLKTLRQTLREESVATVQFDVFTVAFGGGYFGKPIEFQDFKSATDFEYSALAVNERTPLGRAVPLSMKALNDKKLELKNEGTQYMQPILLIVSDGHDNDEAYTLKLAQELARERVNNKKLVVVPITFSEDDKVLSGFTSEVPPTNWRGWDQKKFTRLIHKIGASRDDEELFKIFELFNEIENEQYSTTL